MKRRWLAVILLASLVPWAAWAAGKDKQKKKGDAQKQQAANLPAMPMSPEQTINQRISEMLGAWQIGDTDLMHKYYADDVTVVSGLDEPLLVGWPNYLAAYERQHARVQGGQILRRNTHVVAQGDVAWASYQWQFGGLVDGKPFDARGHTTLIFENRNGVWLIVHNHTSSVPEPQPPPQQQPAQTPPPPKPGD